MSKLDLLRLPFIIGVETFAGGNVALGGICLYWPCPKGLPFSVVIARCHDKMVGVARGSGKTPVASNGRAMENEGMCVCVCMHACMHACRCACVCVCAHVCVRHVCMHECVITSMNGWMDGWMGRWMDERAND